MRRSLVLLAVLGCGGKNDPPSVSGSASGSSTPADAAVATPAGSGSAAVTPAGSGSATPTGSGSAVALSKIPLGPGETVRAPLAEMAWQPPAGKMTVTLLSVGDKSRLVVWNADKRHDVINTKGACINNLHGADLTTGVKNTVVFRCEELGKRDVFAEEWMIRWLPNKDFPTVYRHWRGARFQKDPRWAGGKLRYPEQAVDDNDSRECCCFWEDEDSDYERTSMRYCKGSEDHHGVCVDDAKCQRDEE